MKKFIKENPGFVSFFLVILLFGITSFAEVMRLHKDIDFCWRLIDHKNTEIHNLEDSIYYLNRDVEKYKELYEQDHRAVESLRE